MLPCIQGKIPIYVRNIFNPEHPGTVIEGRACALDEAAEQTLYGRLLERLRQSGGALVSIAHRPALAALHPMRWQMRGGHSSGSPALYRLEQHRS
jgi:aspartokinase